MPLLIHSESIHRMNSKCAFKRLAFRISYVVLSFLMCNDKYKLTLLVSFKAKKTMPSKTCL